MELSKTTMKRIMLLIAFTVLLLVGVQRLDVVLDALGFLWGILAPLFVGAALAFVLNVPMSALERRLFPRAGEKKGKKKGVSPALARAVCLLLPGKTADTDRRDWRRIGTLAGSGALS